jgi:hypothetical protein
LYEIQDDVIYLETHGDFTVADMRELDRLHGLVGAVHGYVLYLVQNIEPGTIGTEARRVAVESNRLPGRPAWSMALYGYYAGVRGLLARAAVTLVAQAIRTLTGGPFALEFLPDEAQARDWLYARRQVHQRELSSGRP